MTRFFVVLACLGLAPWAASAQVRYSSTITLGFGAVPKDYSNRLGSLAGSLAVYRSLGRIADLGLEAGYQRFGSRTERYTLGACPVLPPGACVGEVTGSSHERGDVRHVGPTLRLHTVGRPVRFLALVGLAYYASNERHNVVYRDDRGGIVPDPESFEYANKFTGIGGNLGVGVEGEGLGRLRWTVVARTHGAIGGSNGELASLETLSLTAGVTLPWGPSGAR